MLRKFFLALMVAILFLGTPTFHNGLTLSLGPNVAEAGIKKAFGTWLASKCLRNQACRGEVAELAEDGAVFAGKKILQSPTGRKGLANIVKGIARRFFGKDVTVYRVEGSSNARLIVGKGGKVGIVDNDNVLFLTFGNKSRAMDFLGKRVAQGLDGAGVKQFRVSREFVDRLRFSAVPEREAAAYPNSPIQVDVRRTFDSFGLRPSQVRDLIDEIIPGSGKAGF